MTKLLIASLVILTAIALYYYSKKNSYKRTKKTPFHDTLKIK